MPTRPARSAVSLLELLAVVALVGVFVAVAAGRFGQSAQGNFAARGDARRLALDLVQCQRRAIASGANHYLEFTTSSGAIVGYTLYQRTGPSSGTAVDAYQAFSTGLTVTSAQSQLEFTFDGSALTAYAVTLAGANQTRQVSVTAATGNVRVQ
jgi:type II secretory pathway pseudopilin PulG